MRRVIAVLLLCGAVALTAQITNERTDKRVRAELTPPRCPSYGEAGDPLANSTFHPDGTVTCRYFHANRKAVITEINKGKRNGTY